METPKLFVSYSWSSQEREKWVLRLATELVESGVDVKLDKWDLKKGHDSINFMEEMVNNPEIKKVIMVVDKEYADKSNSRSGGVGTEAQIISSELYSLQKQEKFVAIAIEKDDSGKVHLPTYYKSRIYIDFTEPHKYSENFEELLRWVYDKPIHLKPKIGNAPSYIANDESPLLATSSLYKRVIDAIHNNKPNWLGVLHEYFTAFSEGLENFRIKPVENKPFDDAVVASIDAFLPFKDQLLNVIKALNIYIVNGNEYSDSIHRFLESLIPYQYNQEHNNSWNETDFDNFKFIINEIFVSVIAVLLKYERFIEVNKILGKLFYVENNRITDFEDNTYLCFRHYIKSINNIRNDRLKLNSIYLQADLLSRRYEHSVINFREYMQSDFVLYLRHSLGTSEKHQMWLPNSSLYTVFSYLGPFEVFSRSRSLNYFDKFKVVLGIENKRDLEKLFEEFGRNEKFVPKWDYSEIPVRELICIDKIATLP